MTRGRDQQATEEAEMTVLAGKARAETTFLDDPVRELDSRSGDGIEVTLLWEPDTERVLVAVVDARTGDTFRIDVDPADALEAFRHPYAYGNRPEDRGVVDEDGVGQA